MGMSSSQSGSSQQSGVSRADLDNNWRDSLPPAGQNKQQDRAQKQAERPQNRPNKQRSQKPIERKVPDNFQKAKPSTKSDAKPTEGLDCKQLSLKLDNERLRQSESDNKSKGTTGMVESERLKGDSCNDNHRTVPETGTGTVTGERQRQTGKPPDVSRLKMVVAAQLVKVRKEESEVRAAKGDLACRTGIN